MADNDDRFLKALNEQIERAEKLLKESLWATEQARETLIQLRVQKSNLYIAMGVGSLR